jgi:DNA replication protein DnaC
MSSPATTKPADCNVCGDTGWKHVPPADGKKTPQVVRCDCRNQSRIDGIYAKAGVPERFKDAEIGNFKIDIHGVHKARLALARLTAEVFVEKFPAVDPPGLLITGHVGSGKSHLAIGIVKHIIRERKFTSIFADFRELLKRVRYSYNPEHAETEHSVLAPYLAADVLVLDDMGAEKESPWVEETIGYILNSRYNTKKAVVITTNLEFGPPIQEKEANDQSSAGAANRATRLRTIGDRMGLRIYSRLGEMCKHVDLWTGYDWRNDKTYEELTRSKSKSAFRSDQ